jgi:dihydroxyacetone kinase
LLVAVAPALASLVDVGGALILSGFQPSEAAAVIDAFAPFARELTRAVASGDDLGNAWRTAAEHAPTAAQETAHLQPRLGRARPHAARSVGHPDAGAVSLACIVTAVGAELGALPNAKD